MNIMRQWVLVFHIHKILIFNCLQYNKKKNRNSQYLATGIFFALFKAVWNRSTRRGVPHKKLLKEKKMKRLSMNHNEKGFTLIELMIVIAIIGILAAIAIPNFISYRDKSFCSAAESDANSIAGGLADYFAIPANISYATVAYTAAQMPFAGSNPINLTGANRASVTQSIGVTGNTYTIMVEDTGGRCPQNYMAPGSPVNGEGWKWLTAGTSYFQKVL